jgi:hypothetical protein
MTTHQLIIEFILSIFLKGIKCVFESVITTIAFQSAFHLEMHQNNFFLKKYF